MANELRLMLTLDDTPLPIRMFDGVAVGFPEDVDVFGRDVRLEIAIPGERDRRHFHDVLRGESLEMSAQLDDGALVYRCGTDARLPAGTYDFRLSVAGLTPAKGRRQFTVPDDGDSEVTVPVPFVKDGRRVTLTADPAAFDPLVKAL